MSDHHININQLTNIESNYYLGVNAYEGVRHMQIGKDKVYTYYRLLKKGFSVEEIYFNYKQNKKCCGRKEITLSQQKVQEIHELLGQEWSLDAIAGRDKLMGHSERVSTKTLYKLVKNGSIDAKKVPPKGKNNPKNHKETRGRINDFKIIHQRDEWYPKASMNQEYGHFERNTIIGKNCQPTIVTLVEKTSKYIVLLKASRKSQDVKDAILNWLNEQVEIGIKIITFDRGKEFSRWKEIEQKSKLPLEIYFSDPGAPGQRGLNDNSNSIVRQDLPKSTDLSVHSQKKLNEIAMKYNRIPRKSLNYYTPAEIMKKATGLDSLLPIA